MKLFGVTSLLLSQVVSSKRPVCFPLAHCKDRRVCLPVLSYGTGSSTSRLTHDKIEELTETWLEQSFGAEVMGVDTAYIYKDEADVGSAIQSWMHKHEKQRQDIFVTTKVPCTGKEETEEHAHANLEQLKLEYVDVLLVHFPNKSAQVLNGTWSVLVDEFNAGRARAIGVSNFMLADLELLATLSPQKPSVNQIRMHAGGMPPQELIDYCVSNRILLESYNPLGTNSSLLHDPVIAQVASRYQRTNAQVALRYLIQKGFAVTFTSSKTANMQQDLAARFFRISPEDMRLIDSMGGQGRSELLGGELSILS